MTPNADIYPSAHLQFKDVTFAKGDRLLIEGLSFSLDAGRILWITGENGIGKTSILKLALGFWRPMNGAVEHFLGDKKCRAADIMAYLGHLDAFEPLLTTRESLEFWSDIYESERSVSEVCERVGLTRQRHVRCGALSAGQKRRLAFARILLSGRPVWVLDEPKAAMDKRGQKLTDALIEEHVRSGGSALVATHDEVKSLGRKASRIVMEPSP